MDNNLILVQVKAWGLVTSDNKPLPLTNTDYIPWRHMASPETNELMSDDKYHYMYIITGIRHE